VAEKIILPRLFTKKCGRSSSLLPQAIVPESLRGQEKGKMKISSEELAGKAVYGGLASFVS
jgi:hypothetical protein